MRSRKAVPLLLLLVFLLQGCVGAALVSDERIEIPVPTLKSRSEVITALGEPARADEKTLFYKLKERRMKEFIPALLFPIPLYLPVGREELTFHLEENSVSRAVYRRSRITGGFCGFVPDENTHVDFKFGCSSPARLSPAAPPL